MSERTLKLKKQYLHKAICAKREEGKRTSMGYRPEVKIDIDRPRLITESYKETDGQPECIRQAKALAHFLDNRRIFIFEDERIVGNYGCVQAAIPCYPELEQRGIMQGVAEGDLRNMLNEDDRLEFLEICKYWEGKSVGDRARAVIPEEARDYYDVNGACETLHHRRDKIMLVNFEQALKVGLNGLINQAETKLQELKAEVPKDMDAPNYIESKHFLEAALITLKATIRFANRFAVLAREMAQKEERPWRKKELEEISEACDWVPANPPRTFYEALQGWFFIHLVVNYLETLGQGGGCMFDLLMYPYYKKDIDEGRITREQAQELLEFLWLRINEGVVVSSPEEHASAQGAIRLFQFGIGGVTRDGKDVTNELSFIMVDASMELKTLEPLLILRYHENINPDIVMKVIDCIRTGMGYPSIFNDNAVIPFLLKRGVPLEDARQYGVPVCVELILPGKSTYCTSSPSIGVINLCKCFELSLNQGIDMLYGRQLGCATPDATTFRNYDDMLQAYLKQVNYVSSKMATIDKCASVIVQEYRQRILASTMIDGCIEEAHSCMKETYPHITYITNCGPANVADSLAVLKKLVFDDKKVTMKEFMEILKNNWEGQEVFRQECINKVPKYGNDDDYVDMIARDVFHKSQEEVQKNCDIYGSPLFLEGSIAGAYWLWGRKTAATPDGRKAKDTLADGSGSPMAGRDKSGPTAVLNSVGKLSPPPWATLTNQRFMPQFLEGENKMIFAQYLKTFFDLGIWHIQFNVVDDSTLLDAQEHPENYDDLIVRVAGFSAYFVDLSKFNQDQIIARTAQSF